MCQKGLPKAACKILLLFAITAGLSQMSKPQTYGTAPGYRGTESHQRLGLHGQATITVCVSGSKLTYLFG
jgi:hypothetical protein